MDLFELDLMARHQHGLVTRSQLLQLTSSTTIERWKRAGLLITVVPGVYRVAGSPVSWRQRAHAACLSIGSPVAVSGLAAGYLLRAEGIARPRLQLTVPPERRPTSGFCTARRQTLPAADIVQREQIPVTSPARTLIDLSATSDPALVRRVYDHFVRRGQLRPDQLASRLAGDVPRCDRRGLERLTSLDRHLGGSHREDWVVDTLVGAELPRPERHVLVELEGRMREIDCAYVAAMVAIEYDGWAFHRDRGHFDDDREKAGLLQLAGWLVLQVTGSWSEQQLVDRVRAALGRSTRHVHPAHSRPDW